MSSTRVWSCHHTIEICHGPAYAAQRPLSKRRQFCTVSHNLCLSYYITSWMREIQIILWTTPSNTKKRQCVKPGHCLRMFIVILLTTADNNSSYFFSDDFMQIWNAQICFHKRNLIHFFRKWSMFHSVFKSNIIFRNWTRFRHKKLLKIKQITLCLLHLVPSIVTCISLVS